MVDISGLDKVLVLQILYNNARQIGNGFLVEEGKKKLTLLEAIKIFDDSSKHNNRYFDYVNGRLIKVDLSKDEFDPFLYDRQYGEGKAQKLINLLKPLYPN